MLVPFCEFDFALWEECIAYCGLTTAHHARAYGCCLLLAVLGVLLSSGSGYAQGYDITFDEVGFPSVPSISHADPPNEGGESGPALEPPEPADPVQEGASLPDPATECPADEEPTFADLAKAMNPSTVCDDPLTFVPGVRIQPRFEYDDNPNNNDFYIRRFRLKGSGSAYGVAKYGVELKIDNTNRFEANPSAQVENAWLDFPINPDWAYLRAGLYDIPISRNALTSDSKLLFMDRTLIKEALTAIGFADNTVGVMLHGRPFDGRFEYDIGAFDNVFFEKVGTAGTRHTGEIMPAGRFMVCLLDPAAAPEGYADYKESYLGEGQRLDFAVNGGHLGDAFDAAIEFDNVSALGGDMFFNAGPYVFQSEFDWFVEDIVGGGEIIGDGWYVQSGYLLGCYCHSLVEAAARYQVLDLDTNPDTLRWTSLGFNFYIRDHNLKVQTDYTFREGGPLDEDVFEVQLQLDF